MGRWAIVILVLLATVALVAAGGRDSLPDWLVEWPHTSPYQPNELEKF